LAAEKAAAEKAVAEKAAEEAKQTKGGTIEKTTAPQTSDRVLWIMLAVVFVVAAGLAVWMLVAQK
jgi:cell division protein FtsL